MRCNECRFVGEDLCCHRNPPQPYFGAFGVKFVWPAVSLFTDWCGKGEAKAAAKPVTAVSEGLDQLLGRADNAASLSSPAPLTLPPLPKAPVKQKGKPGRKPKR